MSSSSAARPRQRTQVGQSLLIETDMSSQARDLLIIFGVDVRENGVLALEQSFSHEIATDASQKA